MFFGRNDAKAETPVLWPPHAKSWLIGKDSDAGRDWGQEEKWMTEDEMAGWHHWLDGREFEWTPGVGDGQGGLACCDSWGRNESDMTEQLNWTEYSIGYMYHSFLIHLSADGHLGFFHVLAIINILYLKAKGNPTGYKREEQGVMRFIFWNLSSTLLTLIKLSSFFSDLLHL